MTESNSSSPAPGPEQPALPQRDPWLELKAGFRQTIAGMPWLWPYGALGLLLFVVTFNAWFTTGSLVIGGDAVVIHYSWFEFWRDEIGAGRFPFWNPYTFGGFPAFATPQSGFAYPPHWALTWLPAILAINWLIGFHLILAGISTAWCAGKLGANRDGQFLAGACFALGSAFTGRMVAGHFSFYEALAWLPLATGLAITISERHRPWQLALVVGMMTLAAQPEVTIYAAWWLPVWVLGVHFGRGRREVAVALGRTAVGLGLGVGVAAFFLLPVIELQNVSNRSLGFDWDYRTGGSLPFWHLLELANPLVFGDPNKESYWPGPQYEWHERLLFIGCLAFAVGLFARGRLAWACRVAAVAALLLAFGRYVPWYTLTASLPGYEYMRVPGRHVELTSLALALVAGIGLKHLPRREFATLALCGATLLMIGSLTVRWWMPAFVNLLGGTDGPQQGQDLSLFVGPGASPMAITAIILAAAAMLVRLPGEWFRRAVLVMAVLEVLFVLDPYRLGSYRPVDLYGKPRQMLAGTERRAIVLDGAVAANFGPVLKSIQPGGYTSLFSLEYMALVSGFKTPGVVLEAPEDRREILILLGYDSALNPLTDTVYLLARPPKPAWVARCSWPGGADEARAPGFPLFECVTRADAETREPPQAPGVATVTEQEPGHLVLTANGPGHLITTTPIYPGWSAKIDGKSAPVEALDGALLGVELPEGDHTVVFSYRPAGLTLGLLVTTLSLVAICGIWWWERRRTVPGEPAGA